MVFSSSDTLVRNKKVLTYIPTKYYHSLAAAHLSMKEKYLWQGVSFRRKRNRIDSDLKNVEQCFNK